MTEEFNGEKRRMACEVERRENDMVFKNKELAPEQAEAVAQAAQVTSILVTVLQVVTV